MKKFIKITALFMLFTLSCFTLSACWDLKELNELAIVTGMGIDEAEEGNIAMYIQIASTKPESDASKGSEKPKIIESVNKSTLSALDDFANKLSRKPFLQHSQLLLFGRKQAEKDLASYIDGALRLSETRMEMYLIISDSTAKELLDSDVELENSTTESMAKLLENSSALSDNLSINIFNFLQAYRDPMTAPVVPIVKLAQTKADKSFEFAALAVIQGDKMTGELKDDAFKGFPWLSGSVKNRSVRILTDDLYANVQLSGTKITVKAVKKNGTYGIDLTVKSDLSMKEIQNYKNEEVSNYSNFFIKQTELAIKNEIDTCFKYAKALNADIFKFGRMFYNCSNRKERKDLVENWQNIFPNLKLNVKFDLSMSDMGNIKSGIKQEHENQYD